MSLLGLITGVCIVWLALTIVGQISVKALTYMRRLDPLGLLPLWYFFAPNPVQYDSVLLFRFVNDKRDATGEWKVAKILYDERWYHCFFNTSRRLQKTIHDLQTALGNLSDNFSNEVIARSSPALAITGYVRQYLKQEAEVVAGHDFLQWCVVRVVSARSNPHSRVVYVSEPCRLY